MTVVFFFKIFSNILHVDGIEVSKKLLTKENEVFSRNLKNPPLFNYPYSVTLL